MFIFLNINCSFAQTEIKQTLTFRPVFGNSNLTNDVYYKLNTSDSIQIEVLKFYISQIELLQDGKIVYKEKNSFHLLDISNEKTLSISFNVPDHITFNQLKFNSGIDSTTNVSGALGGDLDPTKGMYWTWQSGYINFKLEGKSNVCKTRNHEFQFHLGGYQYPFNSLRSITLSILQNEKTDLILDIEQLIKGIDLDKEHHIMSPGDEAILLSEKVLKTLHIQRNEK